MTDWRTQSDLWNGVVAVEAQTSVGKRSTGFVAFFIEALNEKAAMAHLSVELSERGWNLTSVVNLQPAAKVDDEAAYHLHDLALAAQQARVSFSQFPEL